MCFLAILDHTLTKVNWRGVGSGLPKMNHIFYRLIIMHNPLDFWQKFVFNIQHLILIEVGP